MNDLERCPRCDRIAFERLRTHSHCLECNHFPEQWEYLEFKRPRFAMERAMSFDFLNPRGAARFEPAYPGGVR